MHTHITMKNICAVITTIVQIWIQLLITTDAADAIAVDEPLRGLHGAPIINPFDQVTIEVNTDSTIECKANKPITWISELINGQNVNAESFAISLDDRSVFKSNLEFHAITANSVGRYYCVFNDSVVDSKMKYDDEVAAYMASSIYIFVDDPDTLIVPMEHTMIVATQNKATTIPCKPTSPNVNLELIKEDGETQIEGSYDPEVGFVVVFSHIEDSGFYDCRVVDNADYTPETFQLMVNEDTLTDYVQKPIITSETKFFAKEGTFFQLTCSVEVKPGHLYRADFILPNGAIARTNDFMTVSDLAHDGTNMHIAHINLSVSNAIQSRDQGEYKCIVTDYHNNTNSNYATLTFVSDTNVEIKDISSSVVNITRVRKQAQFVIDYIAYPAATLYWYNNRNELISTDNMAIRKKYEVEITDKSDFMSVKFKIKHPELEDFGNYTLVFATVSRNFTATVRLVVSDKPTVSIDNVYVQARETVHMICRCVAYPPADITWSFQPCRDPTLWPDCGRSRTMMIAKYQVGIDDAANDVGFESEQNDSLASEVSQFSEIKFVPSEPGFVRCKARNSIGTDNATGQIMIGDQPQPFMITGIDEDDKIATGDLVKIECGAIVYNYTNEVKWFRDGEPVENVKDIVVEDTSTNYSWRKAIIWNSISKDDEGVYTCEAHPKDTNQDFESTIISINVHDAQRPVIISNFNQSHLHRPVGSQMSLECFVTGLPQPSLMWYKDDVIFVIDNNATNRISYGNGNRSIDFMSVIPEDSGIYKCVGWNRIASDFQTINVEVIVPTGPISEAIYVGVISVILLLVLLSVYLFARVRREKKLIKELKAAGLANFEEGNLESIDPDMNLDEQAELLPYNREYEFPREKLKLGKQLGAGAFGVVVKAVAEGIVPYEEESTVAVKMVKKQTDNEVMKALVSELKIMVHLGQHLNVVNLLGAVTKNIAKREVMVIVEYCRFGNLQSFLVKHRPYFIDQIVNDHIDPMIMRNDLRWSKNSTYNTYNSDAGNPYTSQPGGGLGVVSNPGDHLNSKGYMRHSGFQNTHQIDSCNTEATMLTSGEQEDSAMLSNNSDQPLWRSNYGMDYKGPARSVCTSDIVCWSFQVARGMDYLASRKVLHGDLAARNILLCEDNIVKICDFGLARSMYKNDNYKKKGEAPLPFKWLALESISDHVFSTYSDVWAFGIVMWELFSLGKVPYTGMEANQNLYYKLRDGYRMEKPPYATQDIYDVMLNCWNAKPESRPLFSELETRIGSMLHENVKEHYVDLNDPYLSANINYAKSHQDYLAMLKVPSDEAPKPPLAQEENFYVNDPNNLTLTTPDYVSMSPTKGTVRYSPGTANKSDYIRPDSPTIAKNLDTSPKHKSKYPNKKTEIPEEIPMLPQNYSDQLAHADSDEETNKPNSYTEMSFSNEKQPKAETEYKNIFSPSDNYVNVPKPQNGNDPPSITNPSYVTFNTVNERVN